MFTGQLILLFSLIYAKDAIFTVQKGRRLPMADTEILERELLDRFLEALRSCPKCKRSWSRLFDPAARIGDLTLRLSFGGVGRLPPC